MTGQSTLRGLDPAPRRPDVAGIGGHSWPVRGITNEWLTPPEVIRALGDFDLDPCATVAQASLGQPWPTAARGFEVRDMLDWLYGQGFPKSRDLGDGWGTALKPAHEPICMARKPLDGTATANYERWSVGGLNIDAGRLSGEGNVTFDRVPGDRSREDYRTGTGVNRRESGSGRWPPNVAIDERAAAMLDEQTGPQVSGGTPPSRPRDKTRDVYGTFHGQENPNGIGRSAGAVSRFFYCPKADRTERDVGLGADFDLQPLLWSSGVKSPGTFQSEGTRKEARNNHPTVKPIALMRWLCRLVTPAGGLVLDPFTGSGTTGIAALAEGFRFLGFEQDARWVEIATARISAGAGVSV